MPTIDQLGPTPRGLVSLAQIAALTIAFLASRWLAAARPFDHWMKQRAEAEIARVEVFDTVAKSSEPSGEGELSLPPLALEYFRRYQLNVQYRYYKRRGEQHVAAVWRNNSWLRLSFILTMATIALGTQLALQVALDFGICLPEWLVRILPHVPTGDLNRVILALGVAASASYGLGVALSLMNLDERNASRYVTTSHNLEFLATTELPKARNAAAGGDIVQVIEFIRRVQDQISTEHREWILLAGRETNPERLSQQTFIKK